MPSKPTRAPSHTPEEKAALKEFFVRYDSIRDKVGSALIKVCEGIPDIARLLSSLSPEKMAQQQKKQRELERAALVDGAWEAYLENSRTEGAQYAQAGVGFAAWLSLLSSFRTIIAQHLAQLAREEPRVYQRALDGMNLFIDIGMSTLGEAYLSAKERIIGQQQEAIRELSTPVLQVRPRLLIIPLVGVVDTHRARHLTQAMLQGIRERRARAVVMDITGVPVVDSKVANHLVQACEAARLMGANVILTGVSAEIAQALVTLGAELNGIPTIGDLQGGLEEAERLLGYHLQTTPASSAA
jgi:rsbT co-antagonist protein RsbR